MVELRNGKVAHKSPCFSAIFRDIESAIIPVHHKLTVFWVDPKGVMIGMYPVIRPVCRHQLRKVFTAILRNVHIGEYGEYPVLIFRVYVNFRVIERSVTYIALIVYFFPFKAAIFRFVQRILFCFNQGIDNLRFSRSNGNTNSTQVTGR